MFGTRSEQGERAVERLLTIVRTCQLQQLSALVYLSAAIAAHRRRQTRRRRPALQGDGLVAHGAGAIVCQPHLPSSFDERGERVHHRGLRQSAPLEQTEAPWCYDEVVR